MMCFNRRVVSLGGGRMIYLTLFCHCGQWNHLVEAGAAKTLQAVERLVGRARWSRLQKLLKTTITFLKFAINQALFILISSVELNAALQIATQIKTVLVCACRKHEQGFSFMKDAFIHKNLDICSPVNRCGGRYPVVLIHRAA
jgi:hypothetical protein